MCGQVRYRLTAEPESSTVCYCGDCRKAAGSQSVAWVTVPAAAYQVVSGEPARFESSLNVLRTFCGRCGTSLTYQNTKHGNSIDVTAASLEDPGAFPPSGLVYASQKLPWDACLALPVVHDVKPHKKP
jgi:hypothetical protein